MVCELATQLTSFPHREIFALIVWVGFFFFDYIAVPLIGLVVNRSLPDKAPRKDKLDLKDHIFVNFNRLCSIVFLYFLVQTSCSPKYYKNDLTSLALNSATGAFDAKLLLGQLAFFAAVYFPVSILVYDFGYTIFHRILHYNWLYPLVHKHHHLQYCPYRGNVDAINVHPFEFLVGEFNHLLTVAVMGVGSQKVLGYTPHAAFVLIYIVITGILSTMNHTRIDMRIPYVYTVWWHDLHHRFPPCNYGQYTMFWDVVFGWYLPEETRTIVGGKKDVNGDGSFVEAEEKAASPGRPSLVQQRGSAAVPVDATPTPKKGRSRSSSAKKKR